MRQREGRMRTAGNRFRGIGDFGRRKKGRELSCRRQESARTAREEFCVAASGLTACAGILRRHSRTPTFIHANAFTRQGLGSRQ